METQNIFRLVYGCGPLYALRSPPPTAVAAAAGAINTPLSNFVDWIESVAYDSQGVGYNLTVVRYALYQVHKIRQGRVYGPCRHTFSIST